MEGKGWLIWLVMFIVMLAGWSFSACSGVEQKQTPEYHIRVDRQRYICSNYHFASEAVVVLEDCMRSGIHYDSVTVHQPVNIVIKEANGS